MMLEINTNFNKYKIPTIFTSTTLCVFILFSYLTYIPNPTFAADSTINPINTITRSDTATDQRTLMNIKYMQQMSDQICTNTKENKTKQLIDIRDGKSYWVTKLKDGNCWMTQNLDYDGGGTNISPVNWEPDTTAARYYDPGNYYYNGPNNDHSLGDNCTTTTGLHECPQFSTTGDKHYHIGNYYSWIAATNSTGLELLGTGGKAAGSICPAEWQLPTSGPSYDQSNGSFYNLLNRYGLDSKISNTVNGITYTIYSEPLYFVYGGRIQNNTATWVGARGFYSSSVLRANSETLNYLDFYDYTLTSDGSNIAKLGQTVRCLYHTSVINPEGNNNADETLWCDYEYPDICSRKEANVSIKVAPVISIDATSGMSSEVDFTTVAHGDITATISSNQKYQVLLSTNQSTLEQSPIVPNHNIPMITTDTTITPGTRAWGIQKTNATLYSPIGIGNNKVLFYESLGAESKTITFPVAISVDSTLPSGTYATEVTITATAN